MSVQCSQLQYAVIPTLDFNDPRSESVATMSGNNVLLIALLTVGMSSGFVPAIAQSNGCENPQSSAEELSCSTQRLAAADADMKVAFEQALDQFVESLSERKETVALPKSESEEQLAWERRMLRKLKTSQTKWLAYRESACAAVSEDFHGGSIEPLERQSCMTDLTNARAKFLRDYFHD